MPLFARLACSLRFALLAVAVLLSLGLNQREVTVLRQPLAMDEYGNVARPLVEEVQQKVAWEATLVLAHYTAPPALAWLPAFVPAVACWLPGLRRVLAVPRLLAGVRSAEVFRVRLLAVALSPQAP